METKKMVIYFGAAGAGLAYCQHSGKMPDIFVDNDPNKWGTSINGVKIMAPNILTSISLQQIIITSGYCQDIHKQILSFGIDQDKIHIPPKSLLIPHLFEQVENRIQTAGKLFKIMAALSDRWNVVSVGGTALGFVRGNDFIHWDSDIDLFAPIESRPALFDIMQELGYEPEYESESLKATVLLENGVKIPLSVEFFHTNSSTFIDRFQDYTWEWPTQMFTQCAKVDVHGNMLNVPNPPEEYLSKVFGTSWAVPNPEFCYSDYTGTVS